MHPQFDCNDFIYFPDIRTSELVQGRSINLALSVRGRRALAEIGLEKQLLEHGIPMRGRMLHDLKGRTQFVPYDPNGNQVLHVLRAQHQFKYNIHHFRIAVHLFGWPQIFE